MLKSTKFQINNFLKIFVIIFFIINTLLSQEKNFSLKIQSNPTNLNYWWLDQNNFGIKYDDLHFESKWEFNKSKTNYVIHIK